MSTMGLAARPGTAVLPKCSMRRMRCASVSMSSQSTGRKNHASRVANLRNGILRGVNFNHFLRKEPHGYETILELDLGKFKTIPAMAIPMNTPIGRINVGGRFIGVSGANHVVKKLWICRAIWLEKIVNATEKVVR